MRRAAVSIGSNIAEGAARKGEKEFIRFLYMAVGSATELDTQLEISKAIGFGDVASAEKVQTLVSRVTMMLYGLIRASKHKLARERGRTSQPLAPSP
jgi:four helix bundle protein